jgi:Contact-dependent growth inhibition CdiA C-terminal domain
VVAIYGPDGGPPIPVKVEPEDFHDVAQQFVDAGTTVYQLLTTLFRVLSGFRGPAGVDDSAKQFDAAYRPAADTVVTGVNRAVNLLGDIGLGIDTSARNHWNADAAVDPSGGQPPPWSPVDTGLVLPQSLAVPSLVGSPAEILPPPLLDRVPMGHIDDLHTVARAFRTARDTIDDTSTSLHNALEYLFSNNQSADLDALDQFWNHVGGNSDTAILTALRQACDQIATAVDDYADWTVDTQNQILDAVGEFLKNAALGAVAAILLGLISDGLGALAGVFKAADELGEGGALAIAIDSAVTLADGRLVAVGAAAGGVVGAMTAAINGTPNPDIDPTQPQSVTDAQEQQAAEDIGDLGGKGKIDESQKKFSPEEKAIANRLADQGHDVTALKESNVPNVRTPDSVVDGVPTEFKTVQTETPSSKTVMRTLNDSARNGGQARDIIIDSTENGKLSESDALAGIRRFAGLGMDAYDHITIWGDGWTVTWP